MFIVTLMINIMSLVVSVQGWILVPSITTTTRTTTTGRVWYDFVRNHLVHQLYDSFERRHRSHPNGWIGFFATNHKYLSRHPWKPLSYLPSHANDNKEETISWPRLIIITEPDACDSQERMNHTLHALQDAMSTGLVWRIIVRINPNHVSSGSSTSTLTMDQIHNLQQQQRGMSLLEQLTIHQQFLIQQYHNQQLRQHEPQGEHDDNQEEEDGPTMNKTTISSFPNILSTRIMISSDWWLWQDDHRHHHFDPNKKKMMMMTTTTSFENLSTRMRDRQLSSSLVYHGIHIKERHRSLDPMFWNKRFKSSLSSAISSMHDDDDDDDDHNNHDNCLSSSSSSFFRRSAHRNYLLLGTSVHSIESALQAYHDNFIIDPSLHPPPTYDKDFDDDDKNVDEYDYMLVGTCYPTPSHPEKKHIVEGPALPGQVRQALEKKKWSMIQQLNGLSSVSSSYNNNTTTRTTDEYPTSSSSTEPLYDAAEAAAAVLVEHDSHRQAPLHDQIPRRRRIPKIIAVGGIDESNCHEPIQLGADGIAVIRAVLHAPDPAQATSQLYRIMSMTQQQQQSTTVASRQEAPPE